MKDFLQLLMPAWMLWGLGLLGGDSTSQANQTTNQTDARVTGGNGSQNISGSGNSVSVSTTNTTTDAGAVRGALNLAALTSTLVTGSAADFADNTRQVFNTSIKANQQSAQLVAKSFGDSLAATSSAFNTALSGLDKAYETAKAGDQREVSMVVTVAIALTVAATLAAIFGNKKG